MDKHKTIVDCFIEAFQEAVKPQLDMLREALGELGEEELEKLEEKELEENSDEKEINKLD